MPLFTVISGYLYASRPVVAGSYLEFVLGKARRLLLPMCVVATAEYLMRAATQPDAPGLADLWQVYVLGYVHYWFLMAVFLAFLVVAALEVHGRLATMRGWLVYLGVATLLMLVRPFDGRVWPFSLGGAAFLLPFFLLGVGLQRWAGRIFTTRNVVIAAVLFVASMTLFQINWVYDDQLIDSRKGGIVGVILGASAILLLFRFRPSSRVLAWVGGYAFTIYLFQGFATSIARLFVADIREINPHLYFATLILSCVILGIGVEEVCKRVPVLSTLVLGIKYRKPTRKSTSPADETTEHSGMKSA